MASYLKLFETISEYTENLATLLLPNVSVCKDNLGTVMYKPKTSIDENTQYIKFTLGIKDTDINKDIELVSIVDYIDRIEYVEIDNVKLNEVITTYRFDTIGEHTVKFYLAESLYASIFNNMFRTSITFEFSKIIEISNSSNIPVGENIRSIIFNSLTPPDGLLFENDGNGTDDGTIYVPTGATEYDEILEQLGSGWTKVEA